MNECLPFNGRLNNFNGHRTKQESFEFICPCCRQVSHPTGTIILVRQSLGFLSMLDAKRGRCNSFFYSLRCDATQDWSWVYRSCCRPLLIDPQDIMLHQSTNNPITIRPYCLQQISWSGCAYLECHDAVSYWPACPLVAGVALHLTDPFLTLMQDLVTF